MGMNCLCASQIADLTCLEEIFLDQVRWESRSGGYKPAETNRGDIVSSFIVQHRTFNNSKEHYTV